MFFFQKKNDDYVFDISTCTLLAPSSITCILFLKNIYQHKLLDFVYQCCSSVFNFFPSQNSKLVYTFETLSFKLMQGNGVVYFTVLVPGTLVVVKVASCAR